MDNDKNERARADIEAGIHHLESNLKGIQSDLNRLPRFGDDDRENDYIAREERELQSQYDSVLNEIHRLERDLRRL